MRIAGAGHVVFAMTLVALGLMGLRAGDFAPVWTGVPRDMPGRVGLAYACGGVSLGCGIGLLWARTAGMASRVLLAALVAWMLAFRVPLIVRSPSATVTWWACGETAVMIAAAWILVAWSSGDRRGMPIGPASGVPGLRVSRMLYGLAMIPFGIAHFTYLDRTIGMVPAYLPWHLAWAVATGCAFIAAGVAVLAGAYAPLATALSVLQLGLFTLLVWVPVVLAGADPSQWTEFVVSCALTAGGWVVADSYRDVRRRSAEDRPAHVTSNQTP